MSSDLLSHIRIWLWWIIYPTSPSRAVRPPKVHPHQPRLTDSPTNFPVVTCPNDLGLSKVALGSVHKTCLQHLTYIRTSLIFLLSLSSHFPFVSFWLNINLYVYSFRKMSVSLSLLICLFINLFICLAIYLYIFPSIYLSIYHTYIHVRQTVLTYLSKYLFIYLSTFPSIYLSYI